jgi:NADPH:quinone reductase-like Zn-dependent oxidoreductase
VHTHYEYPLTPGTEGSGTVVQNGGGVYGWSLVGKRVAFLRKNEEDGRFTVGGSYAQYAIVN